MKSMIAAMLLAATSLFGQVTDYRDVKTPPLRNFNPPVAKRIQLDNGLVIFLMEDHELPLIRGSAEIRGGARDLPAAKAGMMGIYGSAWRTGGTKDKTGDQLDELLESRAARIETGGGDDATSIRLDVLKNDFDFVFPIWLDLLRNPEFRQAKIDLAKTQANTGISRRNDNPQGILIRETQKLGYGNDSPYVRQPEYATIATITRDDLLAFHDQYVHPNNMILGISGDFDSNAMEKKLRDAFGKWAKGPQAPPPPPVGTGMKPGI
ncbi:MAG TPA: pitrilysin family protein, partial [Thermoanaerobaculia bacterium]|nr:pitrilysin family protein [Thermoanaerobaculia bacterium]